MELLLPVALMATHILELEGGLGQEGGLEEEEGREGEAHAGTCYVFHEQMKE